MPDSRFKDFQSVTVKAFEFLSSEDFFEVYRHAIFIHIECETCKHTSKLADTPQNWTLREPVEFENAISGILRLFPIFSARMLNGGEVISCVHLRTFPPFLMVIILGIILKMPQEKRYGRTKGRKCPKKRRYHSKTSGWQNDRP
jgi:hypothetical protein